jgi:hypothetical protein
LKVRLAANVGVGVDEGVAVAIAVAVGDGEGVAVAVGVCEGDGVAVAEGDGVGVGVEVGDGVGVMVAVGVGNGVAVAVGIGDGIDVAAGVGDGVGVTLEPPAVVTTSCGWLEVASFELTYNPSADCGNRANATEPFPVTSDVTSYSNQASAGTAPLSPIGFDVEGLFDQVIPFSAHVVLPAKKTGGPFTVPFVTQTRSTARWTVPVRPVTPNPR